MRKIILLALSVFVSLSALSQTAILMPSPRFKLLDQNGQPAAGACLFFYSAGTSSPLSTYADSAASILNTNPVVMDSTGEAWIYLQNAVSYKVVAVLAGTTANCGDGTQLWSADNVLLVSSSQVGGVNGQLQYNCLGAFCGAVGLSWNSLTQTLSTSGLNVLTGGSLAGTFSGNPIFSGTSSFAGLDGTCYVDGVTYTTIASAVAACSRGTTVVSNASPAQTIDTLVNVSSRRLVLDAGVTITIANGGTLNIGSNGVLEADGATINVTTNTSKGIQINSGWANIAVGKVLGPGTGGTGIGIDFIGAEFAQVRVSRISGFATGVRFTGVQSDGASQGASNNAIAVQHNTANLVGVLWRNGQISSDFEDQDNRYTGGLVIANVTAELQFGDAGTFNKAEGNAFTGFSDTAGAAHSAFVFLNSSYNFITAQFASSGASAFSCTNSPFNTFIVPVAFYTDTTGCQATVLSQGALRFNEWAMDLESTTYVNRDSSVSDAYWLKEVPASLGGGITLFGGANQVVDPLFLVQGGNGVADQSGFSFQKNSAFACEASFGATTLNTGAVTTNTSRNCLPVNSIIDAVVYRITTTITTAANFTIGDGTTAGRFCAAQVVLTAGTTGICFVQADQTGAPGPRQTAAAAVRVTTNVNPGAGAIRLIVYYHTWSPPSS